MGYGIGATKWWIGSLLLNPISMYIHGGLWLGFRDVLALLGAEDFGELAVVALLSYFDIPSSLADAALQLVVGTTMGAFSWLVGSFAYARSQGWR